MFAPLQEGKQVLAAQEEKTKKEEAQKAAAAYKKRKAEHAVEYRKKKKVSHDASAQERADGLVLDKVCSDDEGLVSERDGDSDFEGGQGEEAEEEEHFEEDAEEADATPNTSGLLKRPSAARAQRKVKSEQRLNMHPGKAAQWKLSDSEVED